MSDDTPNALGLDFSQPAPDADPLASPGLDPAKKPYVNPDRFRTGGVQREKLSKEALEERMMLMRERNEQIKQRRLHVQKDVDAFSKYEEEDRQRREDLKKVQDELNSSRETYAKLKMDQVGNREWDSIKRSEADGWPEDTGRRGGRDRRSRKEGGGSRDYNAPDWANEPTEGVNSWADTPLDGDASKWPAAESSGRDTVRGKDENIGGAPNWAEIPVPPADWSVPSQQETDWAGNTRSNNQDWSVTPSEDSERPYRGGRGGRGRGRGRGDGERRGRGYEGRGRGRDGRGRGRGRGGRGRGIDEYSERQRTQDTEQSESIPTGWDVGPLTAADDETKKQDGAEESQSDWGVPTGTDETKLNTDLAGESVAHWGSSLVVELDKVSLEKPQNWASDPVPVDDNNNQGVETNWAGDPVPVPSLADWGVPSGDNNEGPERNWAGDPVPSLADWGVPSGDNTGPEINWAGEVVNANQDWGEWKPTEDQTDTATDSWKPDRGRGRGRGRGDGSRGRGEWRGRDYDRGRGRADGDRGRGRGARARGGGGNRGRGEGWNGRSRGGDNGGGFS